MNEKTLVFAEQDKAKIQVPESMKGHVGIGQINQWRNWPIRMTGRQPAFTRD